MSQGKPGGKREGNSMSPLKKSPWLQCLKASWTTPGSYDYDMRTTSDLNFLIQLAVKEAINSILIPQLANLRQIQIFYVDAHAVQFKLHLTVSQLFFPPVG